MRKGIPSLVVVIAVCIAVRIASGTQTPPVASKEEVRKAIEAGNAQWVDGFRRADPDPIAASFAEDGVNVGKDGTVDFGRAAIRKRTAEYLQKSGPAVSARADIGDFVIDGEMAYEWGTSDARFAPRPGGPEKRTGRYLTCWKRQADGGWKIFRNMSLP